MIHGGGDWINSFEKHISNIRHTMMNLRKRPHTSDWWTSWTLFIQCHPLDGIDRETLWLNGRDSLPESQRHLRVFGERKQRNLWTRSPGSPGLIFRLFTCWSSDCNSSSITALVVHCTGFVAIERWATFRVSRMEDENAHSTCRANFINNES